LKKSKTTLPLKIFSVTLLILGIINVMLNYDTKTKSKYNINTKEITGIITDCTKTDYAYQITLKAKENIIINYKKDIECKLGTKIKAKGNLETPSTNTIFNGFNYQKYLLSKKINYIFNAKQIETINKMQNILYKIKDSLQNRINQYQSKDYLNTFILGNSKNIEEEIINSYQINGISHLLAISGMHITLLATIILFILNKLNKHKKINYIITIAILIFYMFLTNFSPSIIRATLMFIILTIKNSLKLKINTLYILYLVCGLYLTYNPYIIYNIGFLFSFTITFYLILFNKLINKSKNYISKTLMISFIAFLASLPIQINNFFSINILSPLINLIFVPLVSLIIYPLSLLTLVIRPLDIILINIIKITEKLSLILTHISINITLKHVTILFIIIYYLIITYALYKLQKRKIKGLIILALTMIIHTNINYIEKDPTLTMIDVGQGDCFLIKLDHNKGNILIDTGGQTAFNNQKPYDLAKNKIIPYLKSEGISQIDYLILTHGDFDHVGMANNLIKNFKIKNILLNSKNNNELEKEIIKKAIKNKIKYKNINEAILKIKGTKLEFLGSQTSSSENDDSLIIYTKIGNQNILLMGDAEEEREKYILDTYNLNKVDILKVGHHGSKTSTSPELIKQVRPKISLISAGKNNLYGHPHKQTLETLKNSKILITQKDGSVKINLNTGAILTIVR